MNLESAFWAIGPQLDFEPPLLIDYAAEDTLGGWHPGEQYWPCGSLWEVEGKFLYALVRALKPERVVEIGCYYGCSSTHILTALERNGGNGRLLSIDINAGSGSMIPESLRHRWDFVGAMGELYLKEHPTPAALAFEDAFHGPEGTRDILQAIKEYVQPKVVISHDAMHVSAGPEVRWGWTQVFGSYFAERIEPSDCGLAWKVLDG